MEVAPAPSPPVPSRQKTLGAYYTPGALAQVMVEWAVRSADDHVLDPAFGGGVFLRAGAERLAQLDTRRSVGLFQVRGCDLDATAHRVAAVAESALPLDARRLVEADFFDVAPGPRLPKCDAVVGNPPYVRYQLTDGAASRRASTAAGLRPSKLSSTWAPFVAHSVQFVADGGRLAYVLPAELLHAQYADEVLSFVCARFALVTVVLFERRVFPGALEEVVLLLADGAGGRCARPEVVSFADLDDVVRRGLPRASAPCSEPSPSPEPAAEHNPHDKLLLQLVPKATQDLLQALLNDERVRPLGTLARVSSGVVTGNNRFFLLTDAQVSSDQLDPSLLRSAVSKAAHVSGARLTRDDLGALRESAARTQLLVIPRDASGEQLATAQRTLARGMAAGVDQAYKCRVRNPWWSVPVSAAGPPDLLLTYCAGEHHRMAVNSAHVLHTNTIHGVRARSDAPAAALASTWTNSLSLLSSELVGRSYGGGVLKLEPTEAEAVVLPPLLRGNDRLARVDECIRRRNLTRALDLVDEVALRCDLQLSSRQVLMLRDAGELLRARRRGRGAR